jgi:hypothetical protein
MSVIHKKEPKSIDVEALQNELEAVKNKNTLLEQQTTDLQVALCEIYESMVNVNG